MKISIWLKIVFFVVIFFSTFAFYSRVVFGASIVIDAGSVNNVFNGVNSFSSGSFNFASMNPAILPATYDSINQYLYSNFGYDVNDAIDFGSDNLTGWATGQVDNPLNGTDALPAVSADFVAGAMAAGMTAEMLINNGYEYFAQNVPQWGENAKQFFIGKVNDVTGAITDISDGFVTKITTQGLAAYNQVYNSLVNSGEIYNISSSTKPIYGTSFSFLYKPYASSPDTYQCYFSTNYPLYFSGGNNFLWIPDLYGVNRADLQVTSLSCIDNSGNVLFDNASQGFFINKGLMQGEINNSYIYAPAIRFGSAYSDDPYFIVSANYPTLDTSNVASDRTYLLETILSESGLSVPSVDYGSSDLALALKEQLDRLIGSYVNSLTLDRINEIVASIPIGQELVGDIDVSVAIPTDDIIAELTAVIDDAIDDSVIYDIVFDSYYDIAVDVPAEPEPPIDDESDIYVPIDVPINPISAVGSALTIPYMFSSVFEPIFLAFGGGLFSLWLFVPSLIIFVAILWAIK